ncbi:hypothetical protein SDC9_201493 [bioreactor metagenome]|uniref:Uncharacterized protein n=1 Tax=bioreactor metagenome TaxID=1076179 RepID=A0A645IRH5_9ZZZZ
MKMDRIRLKIVDLYWICIKRCGYKFVQIGQIKMKEGRDNHEKEVYHYGSGGYGCRIDAHRL